MRAARSATRRPSASGYDPQDWGIERYVEHWRDCQRRRREASAGPVEVTRMRLPRWSSANRCNRCTSDARVCRKACKNTDNFPDRMTASYVAEQEPGRAKYALQTRIAAVASWGLPKGRVIVTLHRESQRLREVRRSALVGLWGTCRRRCRRTGSRCFWRRCNSSDWATLRQIWRLLTSAGLP